MNEPFRLVLLKNNTIEFNADSNFCKMEVIRLDDHAIEIETEEHYPFAFLCKGMEGVLEWIGKPAKAFTLSDITRVHKKFLLTCKYSPTNGLEAL